MQDNNVIKLLETIQSDMRQATINRDSVKSGQLRTLLALIHNAEAIVVDQSKDQNGVGVGSTEVARRELSYQDIQALLHQEINELNDALTHVDPGSNYAIDLHKKISIVNAYIAK